MDSHPVHGKLLIKMIDVHALYEKKIRDTLLLLSDSSRASAPSGARRSYDFRPSFFEVVNFKFKG